MKIKKGLIAKVIGSIEVDSGTIIINDPCKYNYINNEIIGDYQDVFWNKFGNILNAQFTDNESKDIAVLVSTKYGDGIFDVVGLFEPNSKRASCIFIDFDGCIKL